MRINIAIDGPSASGKSTLAKLLAKRLGYTHLDTGAMYRACALQASRLGLDIDNESAVVEAIKKCTIAFNAEGHICLNQEDVSQAIRSKEIDLLTSRISRLAGLRALMVDLQRSIAASKGYVLDGRDIGSVVLPNAELKIFQTASLESRAKRRWLEYQNKGQEVDYQLIYDELKQRDLQDTQRIHSPLIKTADAIEMDTSDLSIEEMVEWIMERVMDVTKKEAI